MAIIGSGHARYFYEITVLNLFGMGRGGASVDHPSADRRIPFHLTDVINRPSPRSTNRGTNFQRTTPYPRLLWMKLSPILLGVDSNYGGSLYLPAHLSMKGVYLFFRCFSADNGEARGLCHANNGGFRAQWRLQWTAIKICCLRDVTASFVSQHALA